MFLLSELTRYAEWYRAHFPCIVAGRNAVYYFAPDRAAVVEWTANGHAKLEGHSELVPDPYYIGALPRCYSSVPKYKISDSGYVL